MAFLEPVLEDSRYREHTQEHATFTYDLTYHTHGVINTCVFISVLIHVCRTNKQVVAMNSIGSQYFI